MAGSGDVRDVGICKGRDNKAVASSRPGRGSSEWRGE